MASINEEVAALLTLGLLVLLLNGGTAGWLAPR
jgi:hypothetical protein